MPNWQNFAESGCTEDYISLDEVLAIWFSVLIRVICYLWFYGDFIERNVNIINIFLKKSRLQQNFKNPNLFVLINTWWSVWPDLAKFHHFGKIVRSLASFWGLIYYLITFSTYLPCQNISWHWANCHFSKWPNIDEIFFPFGHTADDGPALTWFVDFLSNGLLLIVSVRK